MMNGCLVEIEGKLNGKRESMKNYKQKVQPKHSEAMQKVNKLDNKIKLNLHKVSKISRESQKKISKLSIRPS